VRVALTKVIGCVLPMIFLLLVWMLMLMLMLMPPLLLLILQQAPQHVEGDVSGHAHPPGTLWWKRVSSAAVEKRRQS